jgi:penicillin-binding protein 1B
MADQRRRKKSTGSRKTGAKGSSRKAGSRQRAKRSRSAAAKRRRQPYLLGLGALLLAGLVWAGLAVESAADAAVAALEQDLEGAPAVAYAAPRVLRPGEPVDLAQLRAELRGAGYRRSETAPRDPGAFTVDPGGLTVYRRAWQGAEGVVAASWVEVSVRDGLVASLTDAHGRRLEAFTCEPVPLGAFHGRVLQDREPLPLEVFPPRLVEAVLAAEDSRFRDHRGIDPLGIARAAWYDLTTDGPLQGGSTITQQVLKNRLLGHQRTVWRKLEEALLAPWVEWKLGKDRILEIYLNEVYLGQIGAVSVLGLPAAAEHYFGKRVGDLELDEMAMLAGLISSPGRYHPRRHPERAVARRNRILQAMAEQDFIAPVEREAAARRPLRLASPIERLDPGGDLLDAVRRELTRRGWEPSPGRRPRRIATTIELPLQRAARGALEETLAALEGAGEARGPLEGAVVVLRPASGAIAALVGGRRGARGELNRALDARRQPGSAFKPFVALTAVHELGWLASHEVRDAPLSVGEGDARWSPRNADGRFRGPVTLRRALEESLNVPMARVGLAVGPERIARLARAAGIDAALPTSPALALGVGEVTPLQLASGYQTLASLGRHREPFLVRAVHEGGAVAAEPIPLDGAPPARRVVSREDAYLVLDALAGVIERGTGRALRATVSGWRVAGKTGTSQDGRDAWFALACPRAVVVAWIGRDDGGLAGVSGPRAALHVVRRLLERRAADLLAPLPEPPEGLREVFLEPGEDCAWNEPRAGARRQLVRAEDAPPECGRSLWDRLFR